MNRTGLTPDRDLVPAVRGIFMLELKSQMAHQAVIHEQFLDPVYYNVKWVI
jgi:hypothetical protein